ncbi:MAG TPA: beta-propeller fold lactonase family protein [Herpetosiphonaceae bacterium]
MFTYVRFARLALVLALFLATVAGSGAASAAVRWKGDAVYTATNAASGNAVMVFNRDQAGMLTAAGSYPTGGLGSGDGLGSQGAVILSENGRSLFVVNAGSDTISSFAVDRDGLTLIDTVASGGDRPISLTLYHRVLYVLNGGSSTIAGFEVDHAGRLTMIPDSTRPLSSSMANPAQISFDPDGNVLVVTEKATNMITTFKVNGDGEPSGPMAQPSAGQTPFGFAFRHDGTLLVSEAFGGAPNQSATSSYMLDRSGHLSVISASVSTTETAACWLVVTNDGRYAYTTNTGSSSISGYHVAKDGSLMLLDADGVTGSTPMGSLPIDAALSKNSRFLYVLSGGSNTISGFAVADDGSLMPLGMVGGLPASAVGLAAR